MIELALGDSDTCDLSAVEQAKQRIAGFYTLAIFNEDLLDAATALGQKWNGAKVGSGVRR